MTTAELNASVIRDISFLMEDESAMMKVKNFVLSLLAERKKSSNTQLKTELKADLKAALQELQNERDGKVVLRDARDLINEL